jgi:hypothetical protein
MNKINGNRCIVPAFLLFILFPAAALSAENDTCTPLVTTHCIKCHFETRICQKVGKNKGGGAWKRTIKAMVRNGAQVSKQDQQALVACFSDPHPEIQELCRKK